MARAGRARRCSSAPRSRPMRVRTVDILWRELAVLGLARLRAGRASRTRSTSTSRASIRADHPARSACSRSPSARRQPSPNVRAGTVIRSVARAVSDAPAHGAAGDLRRRRGRLRSWPRSGSVRPQAAGAAGRSRPVGADRGRRSPRAAPRTRPSSSTYTMEEAKVLPHDLRRVGRRLRRLARRPRPPRTRSVRGGGASRRCSRSRTARRSTRSRAGSRSARRPAS